MPLIPQGTHALLKPRVPPSSPSGFGSDRARGREGRSGELRPLPKSQTRETGGTGASPGRAHTRGNLGLGARRTPFVSGGTWGWRDSAKGSLAGARAVLSSSAAEAAAAAAAAARMDFLSHPNSTVQRSSPQSGGIPPASDAAAAAAPRARLGETNCPSAGGSGEATAPRQGRARTPAREEHRAEAFQLSPDHSNPGLQLTL
ncbi:protein SOGA3-like isoform X2 [Peromyscus leucopus]|uniref:protein SOGA3-like isoform X2 n=1 Tax=Peromyscus leucopus TaxID=10041 RepID=UPI0018856B88|nr:protein SOGA3-like isoform X2 [Peromyscus leucopus]